jgi:hypothetical protein
MPGLLTMCLLLIASLALTGWPPAPVRIPLGGNAWSNHPTDTAGGFIDTTGIAGWTDGRTRFTVYFHISQPGKAKLGLRASVPSGRSRIAISIGGVSRSLDIEGPAPKDYPIGKWFLPDTGYVGVSVEGLSKTDLVFAAVSDLLLSDEVTDKRVACVADNDDNFFYWGRRGPSVHLNYHPSDEQSIEWFYNELTVPPGQDVTGSYFMANGFSEGYFGIQVNSATERRILFSVWSPFRVDDPRAVPDSLKVRLVRKGKNVHAGEFGDEGAGGQSYLVYPWVAGCTYKFLIRAQPLGGNTTRFTAWFGDPHTAGWILIASWDRPATHAWLTHLHSFLENFEPEYGNKAREALYGNQWVKSMTGRWTHVTAATFTGDNTARKGYRLDYAGGLKGAAFYLKNGGFFNDRTPLGIKLVLPSDEGVIPQIDTANLP